MGPDRKREDHQLGNFGLMTLLAIQQNSPSITPLIMPTIGPIRTINIRGSLARAGGNVCTDCKNSG